MVADWALGSHGFRCGLYGQRERLSCCFFDLTKVYIQGIRFREDKSDFDRGKHNLKTRIVISVFVCFCFFIRSVLLLV